MKKTLLAVVGVIILAALGVGGYMVYKSMHKTNTAAYSSSSTQGNTSTNTPNQVANQQSATVIQTKTAANVGDYLADIGGYPLYTYGGDTTGVSNCTGTCLDNWPVYSAAGAPATLPANVTIISRSDGSKQYAYKGMPLYTFALDSLGHVTGDGVNNFHVAKP